jgi:conjugal transfer mating pair stabilization protein TraG
MMINAMGDGVAHYQAFTDATAGIVNQQFTKSQVQHRWSWEVLGQKALWILPITHTCLTLLLFGVFPLIIALTTLPGGVKILYGYMQFFMSLQFWPVLFAILNAGRKCNLISVIMLLFGILHSQYVAHKYHSSHYY